MNTQILHFWNLYICYVSRYVRPDLWVASPLQPVLLVLITCILITCNYMYYNQSSHEAVGEQKELISTQKKQSSCDAAIKHSLTICLQFLHNLRFCDFLPA